MFLLYEGEYNQRHVEESRVGKECGRLNMASRLNQTMKGERGRVREEGRERKRTKRRDTKESGIKESREWEQKDQERGSQEDHELVHGGQGRIIWE